MATFEYRAKNKNGEVTIGSLDAASEDVLLSKLKDQELLVLDVKMQRDQKEKVLSRNIKLFERIKTRDLVVFTRQFSTLITSGMSLIESLVVLEKQTTGDKFREIISQVRRDIESGYSLSEAMTKHKIFSSTSSQFNCRV